VYSLYSMCVCVCVRVHAPTVDTIITNDAAHCITISASSSSNSAVTVRPPHDGTLATGLSSFVSHMYADVTVST